MQNIFREIKTAALYLLASVADPKRPSLVCVVRFLDRWTKIPQCGLERTRVEYAHIACRPVLAGFLRTSKYH